MGMVVAVAAASADYGALVGTWDVKFGDKSKAIYKITNDGKVNVLDCDWRCKATKHGVLSKSDKTDFPSSGGWYKVDKIHRDDVALYVREKDCKLELVYYSKYWPNGDFGNGKRVGGSDLALTGTWDVKFGDKSKATYKITNDGKVNVLNCDWRCKATKHGVLSKSDKTKFPSSGGWYKVDKIHRDDVALYVREKDCKLELVYYSKYWPNGDF